MMILKIVQIADRGVPHKERVHLAVETDGDLVSCLVLGTYFVRPSTFYNISSNAYWFEPQKVLAGDRIILYTGPGSKFVREAPDGKKDYFYYWNRKRTIFGEEKACAVVVRISEWQSSPEPAPALQDAGNPPGAASLQEALEAPSTE
jgi:hypothetical protein